MTNTLTSWLMIDRRTFGFPGFGAPQERERP